MPCCQIPNQNNPVFPPRLVTDAQIFSKYVGGMPLAEIGPPAELTVCTSALHLEMKLWDPTTFSWEVNNAERNSWSVMSNRTTAPSAEFPRFEAEEKNRIYAGFNLDKRNGSCALIPYDEWGLETILNLRIQGLAHASLQHPWNPVVHPRPPELATIGLAQKLINIYLKYELCWQVAGRLENNGFVVYAPRRVPNLTHYLCALHAPIDAILLVELLKTQFGKHLSQEGLLNPRGNSPQIIQSADGLARAWSKLDCLRTYYGLQLMLRRIAMNTWTAGCACGGGPKGDPDVAAKALTVACAKWFEKKYGEKHRCGQGQTDWVKAACELPEQVIQETIKELRSKPNGEARSAQSKASSKAKSARPAPSKLSTGGDPASSGQKAVIWLSKLNSKSGEPHETALRVVSECESDRNLGAICDDHSCLDAKKRLVDMIAQNGGDFMTAGPICRVPNVCPPKPKPPGKTCCWGGSGYVAGIHFNSRADAVRYLKQYFEVRACTGNLQVDQEWIDGC